MSKKETFKISFIELLYAVAIGASFGVLPHNPLSNIFGCLVFIFGIGVVAYDWFQYHDSLEEIENGKSFWNFVSQIIVIMLFYEMLTHSFETSLYSWLIYWVIIDLIDIFWNISTDFVENRLYVGTSIFQAVCWILLGYLNWKQILNNYESFFFVIIIFAGLWFFEKSIDKN